jgi:hypothetical protein
VISYNYWTRRFARDPAVLGKTLFVNGVPMTIVGVAAEGFEGVEAGGPPTSGFRCRTARAERLGQSSGRRQALHRQPHLVVPAPDRAARSRREPHAGSRNCSRCFKRRLIGLGGKPMAGEKPPVLSLTDAKSFPGYDEMYGKPLRILMAMVGWCC